MGELELRRLTVSYGERPVVAGLDLRVADGEIVALLGPSGAGKSTILKAVAGLLPASVGEIRINHQLVNQLPAERRDAVLLFQKPLLFPFLDVAGNIAFGLKMAGIGGRQAAARIAAIMAITGLDGLARRRVHQLSGGQQQRVALARGLVLAPSILLLDEPLSSLDAELRQQMRELIGRVQRETGTTMLFVTHDQSEAFAVSDRVALLLAGSLRQTGSAEELFYHPADREVARFFGGGNFIDGRIVGGTFAGASLRCPTARSDCATATAVIRPEELRLVESGGDNCLDGVVETVSFEGANSRLQIATAAGTFTLLAVRPEGRVGQPVVLHFPPERLHIFPCPEGGR